MNMFPSFSALRGSLSMYHRIAHFMFSSWLRISPSALDLFNAPESMKIEMRVLLKNALLELKLTPKRKHVLGKGIIQCEILSITFVTFFFFIFFLLFFFQRGA